jgi:hypothetical protein
MVNAGLSLRWLGLVPRPFHVGFVVSKITLEQVYFRVLRFSQAVSFLHCSILIHSPPTLHKLSKRGVKLQNQRKLKGPVEKQLNFV